MKIEEGYDIPQTQTEFLLSMEIGQSVLIADTAKANAFRVVSQRAGVKLRMRTQPDGQIRMWRIK